jgi:hypothetical protein
VLKLGGSIALYKYNYINFNNILKYLIDAIDKINTFISIIVNKEVK